MNRDTIKPMEVPNIFLKIAPVNPINTATSTWSNTWILAKSIGLNAARMAIGFSMG